MFVTFDDLYNTLKPIKVVRDHVVALEVLLYAPIIKHRFPWRDDSYGPTVIGTEISLKGGHKVQVAHPIEAVEKVLKAGVQNV